MFKTSLQTRRNDVFFSQTEAMFSPKKVVKLDEKKEYQNVILLVVMQVI